MRRIVLFCVLASALMLGSSDPASVIPTSTGQDYLDEDGDERYSENALELKNYVDNKFELHLHQKYQADLILCGEAYLPIEGFISCLKNYVDDKSIYDVSSDLDFWGAYSVSGEEALGILVDKIQAIEARLDVLEAP